MTCSTTTPAELGELVRAGRGGDVDGLVDAVLELLELERAIVARRGQAETVVDEVLLAALVAVPHAVHLRNGGVALVDKEEEIAREIVEQRGRSLAGQAAREVARVVLDAVAVAHGLDHFEIEAGALVNALRLDHAALGFKLGNPFVQLGDDGVDGRGLALRLDHVMALGIDGQARVLLLDGAEERIDLRRATRSRRRRARCGRRFRRRWGRLRSRRRARGRCRGGSRCRCARRGFRRGGE